jgi:uroporphyrinogen decarboxylase
MKGTSGQLPLRNPKPDIDAFKKIILGEALPERVHFAELFLDYEISESIGTDLLGQKWAVPEKDRDSRRKYWDNLIEVYYRLGYDYIRVSGGITFPRRIRSAKDTAAISKKNRIWAEEGTGPISCCEEFEKYPWPSLESVDLWDYEYVSTHLPEGMGLFVCPTSGFLEVPLDTLMGYETLSILLYDDSGLVEAVIEKAAGLIIGFYRKLIGLPHLAGFFQGDDMGFKSSTLISPASLRKLILPWHKKLAELAHENGLLYMLHSCGNLDSIMEDLITDVGIDAKHSFEEEASPVKTYKKKYGDKIALLGGIDVDWLCRLPEDDLRRYIRDTLDTCMQGGRYALGSGNTVCNYVPVKNYLIMLEEGLNWNSGSR